MNRHNLLSMSGRGIYRNQGAVSWGGNKSGNRRKGENSDQIARRHQGSGKRGIIRELTPEKLGIQEANP